MASEACRCQQLGNAPAYSLKGSWDVVHGLKTYTTGPSSATRIVITVYDVFGMQRNTLRGADLLAELMPNTRVIVPDFFEGERCNYDWVPPNTDEKRRLLEGFKSTHITPRLNASSLLDFQTAAADKYKPVTAWAAYGLCWGGKLVALASGGMTPFKATGQAHPAYLAIEDAEAISIPHVCLLSQHDDNEVIEAAYHDTINKNPESCFEQYKTMAHGWMGATAKLEKEEHAREYMRGYKQLAEFFNSHM